MTKIFESCSSFRVGQFKRIVFIIHQLQKISTFVVQCLECYLPSNDKIFAFSFLAKVLRQLPWKRWNGSAFLSFSVNNSIKDPIVSTRIFTEFNDITVVGVKESPKFIGDWCHMNLKGIQRIVENFPSRICDSYNFPNTLKIGSLIYTTSYSK